MKSFKKILSAVLAAVMVMSVLPYAVFANEADVQEAEACEVVLDEGCMTAEESNVGMLALQAEYKDGNTVSLMAEDDRLRGKKVEIAFLIDASGSMDRYIKRVKENITAMAQYFENAGVDLRMSVVQYGSMDDEYRAKVLKIGGSSWHKTTDQLVQTLSGIPADGWCETLSDAVGDILNRDPVTNQTNIQWSSNAYKFAFVLTNDFDDGVEGLYYNDYGYEYLNDTIPGLNEKRIHLSVVTNPGYFDEYNRIATETGGNLYDINSDFYWLLINYANEIMGIALKPTKAIYVLPEYMMSEEYANDGSGDKYYIDDSLSTDFWAKDHKEDFINNESGSHVSGHVGVDAGRDDYGTKDHYKKLVQALENEFGAENGGQYDVKFFPYDWTSDFVECAEKLEKDINDNGYESVVFVTHGAGGLVATTYVADSVENKRKVEKAILIAAPLFGTAHSLMQIESGNTERLMNKEDVTEKGKGGVWKNWVKGWAHNSPMAYQLLPSAEYLQYFPVSVIKDEEETQVSTPGKYYAVLNASSDVNEELTNGGSNKSHKYFRETVLGSDVVGSWSIDSLHEIDVTLIATPLGKNTPSKIEYLETSSGKMILTDISYNKFGDGVVQGFSAQAINKRRPGLNFDTVFFTINHSQLPKHSDVIDTVVYKIEHAGGATASLAEEGAVLMSEEEASMEDMVKISYDCDNAITATIYNDNDEAVAAATGDEFEGFGEDIIYDNFSEDGTITDASIYIPNQGYKVVFSCGDTAGTALDFSSEYSTLDADGWKDTSVIVNHNITIEDGIVSTLDGTDDTIDEDMLREIGDEEDVIERYTEWYLPETVKVNVGDVKKLDVTGSEAEDVASQLTWESSDTSIVEVSADGTITAKNFGRAYVTASNGDKILATEVVVMNRATSVSFADVEMILDEKVLIRPSFAPVNATETDLEYTVNKNGVIEIDEAGVMHAIGAGSVTVTGTTSYGVSGTFVVTVEDDTNYAVEAICASPDSLEIKKGKDKKFTVEFTPANATNKELEWIIGDETIASVTEDGGEFTVTGLENGTTVITVVSVDGGYTAEVEVTVKSKTTPVVDPSPEIGAKAEYTVKFDTDGGDEIKNQILYYGDKVEEPKDPEKDGYIFMGWYKDAKFENEYDFDFKIKHGFTLYAKWESEEMHRIVLTIGKKDAVVFGESVENDVAPMIKNGRTMLPIRFVAEALGASVRWSGADRKVTVIGDDVEIEIFIDSEEAYVNGRKVKLDCAAFIEGGRTFLPLRFISENLGASVDWDGENRTVTITK